jgi:hypothetical protein
VAEEDLSDILNIVGLGFSKWRNRRENTYQLYKIHLQFRGFGKVAASHTYSDDTDSCTTQNKLEKKF